MLKNLGKSFLFISITILNSLLPLTTKHNIIICLHRVNGSRSIRQAIAVIPMKNFIVSKEFFKDLLTSIRSEYDIVPIIELLDKNRNGIGEGLAAITFDDGYRDCYETVLPILKDERIPASCYLNSSFIDAPRLPWWYMLEESLKDFFGEIDVIIHGKKMNLSIKNDRHRHRAIIKLMSFFVELDEDEINNVLEQIYGFTGGCPGNDLAKQMFLTWDMAREMLSTGLVEFGNHGLNHLSLGCLAIQDIEKQISLCHDRIEHELGTIPIGFSFPYGRKKDFNMNVIDILKNKGYAYALTSSNNILTENQNPFSLPRISVRENEGLTGFQTRRNLFFLRTQDLLMKFKQ